MRSAFSLIELLVATVLISLLIGVAIFSFRYQMIAIKKSKEVGINRVLNFSHLRASLSSIKYYVVESYDRFGRAMHDLHFYFEGEEKRIDFITSNPLFSQDIAVAQLLCKEDKLLYTEEPLYGRVDFLRPALLKKSRSEVLYKDLRACSFQYRYQGKSYQALHREIPSDISIKIANRDQNYTFFVHIQSDYNLSRWIIEDAMYPTE